VLLLADLPLFLEEAQPCFASAADELVMHEAALLDLVHAELTLGHQI
jgi:hypothetical protein